MQKKLFVVQEREDLNRCYSVMKELRPHLSFEDYLHIYDQAHKADGYQIAAIEAEGHIVALMGYRFLWDYVRGRHVYIDDLVSTAAARSQGYGAELLRYAEVIAHENGCAVLRLCTGLENEGGIRFYDRNGWIKRAYAYVKKISN